MIAVTYLEGWMLAHPAPVLIFIACCAIAAVYVLYMHAENRRDDREDGLPEAPRRGPRSRARGTRARRHAFLGSACRRARAIAAWVTSWFWWLAAWHPWQAARERIALRARGITVDVGGARPRQQACPRCGTDHKEPHCADGREWGPFPGPETPANDPVRKATGAGRDALALDYQPAAPFADCLSADTIARGFKAVK